MRLKELKDVGPKSRSGELSSRNNNVCLLFERRTQGNSPAPQIKEHLDLLLLWRGRLRNTIEDIDFPPHGDKAKPLASHASRREIMPEFYSSYKTLSVDRPSPIRSRRTLVDRPFVRLKFLLRNGRHFSIAFAYFFSYHYLAFLHKTDLWHGSTD